MPGLSPALAATLAALVVAALLWALRRHAAFGPAAVAAGIAAGWAAGAPGALLRPWSVAEHLPGAALPVLLGTAAAAFVSGRPRNWALFLPLVAAACWLGNAPAARGEFWRVAIAVLVLAALLRARGAGTAGGMAAAASVLLGGAMLALPLPDWGVPAVLLAAYGAAAARRQGAVPVAPMALGLVAASLLAGNLQRGRVGAMDVACAAAVLAPHLPGTRLLAPLLGRLPLPSWLRPQAKRASPARKRRSPAGKAAKRRRTGSAPLP